MLECKSRRQDKDIKCQRGGAGSIPVKVYPQRSNLVISPLTCTILLDLVNPNRDAVTNFNAESQHLLKNRKRDFGFCQYSFACSNSGSGGNHLGSRPKCSKDFGHDLSWRYSINDLGIITLDLTVTKSYNLTIGATETWWNLHLRADRQNCGRTCALNCGTQCGQCSNGVCTWGGFNRMVDEIGFSGWRQPSSLDI